MCIRCLQINPCGTIDRGERAAMLIRCRQPFTLVLFQPIFAVRLPQIHERRQVVDAFADIVDPRWINVDSFIESFATVNTFDVDEIGVRAAPDRQTRLLQLSRQLQAGTRTPFGRSEQRRGGAQQPYLEEPLWLSYADIAAVFEEAGVDPYVVLRVC